ncbi:MAG: hypothetical protein WAW61_13595 [Methylococcaceae bacterium]
MQIDEAYAHLKRTLKIDTGKFYSPGEHVALGVGKIYKNIRYPVYDEEENIFNTASGLVFVLTHECDIDGNNNRLFNTEILINPIIDFTRFIEEQAKFGDDNSLKGFISSLSEGKVSRVIYLPPITKEYLPYGGLMYLNHICSTNVSLLLDLKAQKPYALLQHQH